MILKCYKYMDRLVRDLHEQFPQYLFTPDTSLDMITISKGNKDLIENILVLNDSYEHVDLGIEEYDAEIFMIAEYADYLLNMYSCQSSMFSDKSHEEYIREFDAYLNSNEHKELCEEYFNDLMKE